MYTCEADLEKASNSVEAYRHDVKERESKIHRLSSELRLCYSENERLQKGDNQHQRAQDRLKQEAEYRILALRVGALTRIWKEGRGGLHLSQWAKFLYSRIYYVLVHDVCRSVLTMIWPLSLTLWHTEYSGQS